MVDTADNIALLLVETDLLVVVVVVAVTASAVAASAVAASAVAESETAAAAVDKTCLDKLAFVAQVVKNAQVEKKKMIANAK